MIFLGILESVERYKNFRRKKKQKKKRSQTAWRGTRRTRVRTNQDLRISKNGVSHLDFRAEKNT